MRFRQGKRVPRNVYDGDEPIFVAVTAERAAEYVRLLNGADAPTSETERWAVERLASEAELISKGGVNGSKIVTWAEDNGARIAEVLRRTLK